MGEMYCSSYKDKDWKGRYVALSADMAQAVFESDLPATAMSMLVFIALNERPEAKDIEISRRYIQKGMGISSSTVHTTLSRLLDLNLIEAVSKGYRVKYWRSIEDWKATLVTRKSSTPKRLENRAISDSKIESKATRKSSPIKNSGSALRDPEGGRREEGRADAAAEGNPPALPLRVIEGSKVSTDKYMAELQEELQDCLQTATSYRSPVLKSSYFHGKLPSSYSSDVDSQLLGSEAEELSARTNFLRATNAIVSVWKQHKVTGIPLLPATVKDVQWLGDVVASFLARETPRSRPDDWVQGFREFYSWCVLNKPNLSYNLLGLFLGDWQRSSQTGANRASR